MADETTTDERAVPENDGADAGAVGSEPSAEESEPSAEEIVQRIFSTIGAERDTDLIIFRSRIDYHTARQFTEKIAERRPRRKNVGVVLTTFGGDPDAAYRMGRALQDAYEGTITCYVFGFCKSAGTLVALGADEIVMTDEGELGPLDIQFAKEDTWGEQRSGLDTQEALDTLGSDAFLLFQHVFRKVLGMEGALSVKTATDVAVAISTGLISPITRQIDPLSVGETARKMRIVQDYGWRLARVSQSKAKEAIARLSSDYPHHGFVIDRKEANDLLGNVRPPDADEDAFAMVLRDIACIPPPFNSNASAYIDFLNPPPEAALEEDADATNTDPVDSVDQAVGGLGQPPTDSSPATDGVESTQPATTDEAPNGNPNGPDQGPSGTVAARTSRTNGSNA